MKFEKIPGNAINHEHFDYLRWHLSLRICTMYIEQKRATIIDPEEFKKILILGKKAGEMAVKAKDTFEDKYMLRICSRLLNE